MAHSTEPEPARLTPLPVTPAIARLLAPNPGPMTYHGTNTWLVRAGTETYLIDPGPDHPAHRAALLAALPKPPAAILLTHAHKDHSAGAAALAAATGAPIAAFGHATLPTPPDITLVDGARLGPFQVLHTPGHASDHLCFALPDGTLFTGDHVMGWSSSVIPPPDGDMAAYIASLRRLHGQGWRLFLSGHGPAITTPDALLASLLARRTRREAALLKALAAGPAPEATLTARLYPGLAPTHAPGSQAPILAQVAALTLRAHLLKLATEGRAEQQNNLWRLTQPPATQPT